MIASQQAQVLGDIRTDPGYFEVVPGMQSTVAVPLIHKKKPIGALNILSRARDQYSERDANILRQFASHVATALVNARLFDRERQDAAAFELLAEIGREVTSRLIDGASNGATRPSAVPPVSDPGARIDV